MNLLQAWINNAVGICIRHFRVVITALLLLGLTCGIYTASHFSIDTNTDDLLSAKLPWRQQEIAFRNAFPQTVDLILVDVGAATPEAAEAAARELRQGLADKPELFRSVKDELDNPFFRRSGLLFLAPDQVEQITGQLIKVQPLIGQLLGDPSLRGLVQTLVEVLGFEKSRNTPLDDMARPLNLIAATLEGLAKGRPDVFSWKALLQGDAHMAGLHHYVEVWPVLDEKALEPGDRATAAIRNIVGQLGLEKKFGANIILTGPVIISDNEFSGVHEGIVVGASVDPPRCRRRCQSGNWSRDHGGWRAFDGRRLEPDLSGLCRSIRWPGRRFRDPIHRSLPGGTPPAGRP
jgi:hypothetical protein